MSSFSIIVGDQRVDITITPANAADSQVTLPPPTKTIAKKTKTKKRLDTYNKHRSTADMDEEDWEIENLFARPGKYITTTEIRAYFAQERMAHLGDYVKNLTKVSNSDIDRDVKFLLMPGEESRYDVSPTKTPKARRLVNLLSTMYPGYSIELFLGQDAHIAVCPLL